LKKLLITGATGFIGRHTLASAIYKGYDVYAVTVDEPVPSPEQIKWVKLNLFDRTQLTDALSEIRPSHLLHFAWYAEPGKYWTSVENIKWVQASLELIMAFQRWGGQRAVFAGSCAEYDWNYGYCSENVTPLNPATLYGVCKHSLQHMVRQFSIQTGLSTAWGRIFFLYGPDEHPARLVSSVICYLLEGKEALCSHGEQIRDFMYVQDVANAFVALLDSDVQGPINIASGDPVRIKNVVLTIASKLNSEHLVRLGALPTLPNDPPVLIADIGRIKNEVIWTPNWGLEQAITNTIEFWAGSRKPSHS
jgi:nucleoside-diphosphate-sugar epimerase